VVADAGPFHVKTNRYVKHIVTIDEENRHTNDKWVLLELNVAKPPKLSLKLSDEFLLEKFNATSMGCGITTDNDAREARRDMGQLENDTIIISSPKVTGSTAINLYTLATS